MGKQRRRRPQENDEVGPRREWLRIVLVCAFLAFIVGISFSGALGNGFVNFDDNEYVYENPKITGGLTSSAVAWAFSHFHAGNWHPLTTISHMLDCQLYGLQPWGHHLTSIFFHGAATILLFLALRELIGSGSPRDESVRSATGRIRPTGGIWPSAFVAAVFAVHPLRVESVAWIAERKDVLSGVFFMFSLFAYAKYVRGGRRLWYWATVLGFTFGLMSKPSVVPLPFLLLLLDFWPLGRWQVSGVRRQRSVVSSQRSAASTFQRLNISTSFRGLLIEKIPFFVLSAASCVITVLAQREAISEMRQVAFPTRLANAIISCVVYLRQIFYPTNLAALYLYPRGHINPAVVTGWACLLAVLSILCWIYRKRFPFLVTGWVWYLGMLVPVIGIVQVGNQAHADRYTYLSSIGVYLLVTWLFVKLVSKRRYSRQLAAVLALLIVTGLVVQTRAQTSYWRSSVTLWQHAVESTSNNYQAYTNLGISLLNEGRIHEAIAQHKRSLEIEPHFAETHRAFADALLKGGQIDEAIAHYRKALEIRPDFPDAERNLGDALLQKGRVAEAIDHYRHALAAKPDYPEAQNNLGNALASARRYSEAEAAFATAVQLNPNYADAHNNLGSVLMLEGKIEEAADEFEQAVRINQNYAEAHYNLALALAKLGQRSGAIAELNEALRIKPGYPAAERALRVLQSGE